MYTIAITFAVCFSVVFGVSVNDKIYEVFGTPVDFKNCFEKYPILKDKTHNFTVEIDSYLLACTLEENEFLSTDGRKFFEKKLDDDENKLSFEKQDIRETIKICSEENNYYKAALCILKREIINRSVRTLPNVKKCLKKLKKDPDATLAQYEEEMSNEDKGCLLTCTWKEMGIWPLKDKQTSVREKIKNIPLNVMSKKDKEILWVSYNLCKKVKGICKRIWCIHKTQADLFKK